MSPAGGYLVSHPPAMRWARIHPPVPARGDVCGGLKPAAEGSCGGKEEEEWGG